MLLSLRVPTRPLPLYEGPIALAPYRARLPAAA